MKNAIREILSDDSGLSSKRVITFLLLMVFLFAYLFNLFTAKSPSETFSTQLYLMLTTGLGTILGGNIIDAVTKTKIAESDSKVKIAEATGTNPPVSDITTTNVIKP